MDKKEVKQKMSIKNPNQLKTKNKQNFICSYCGCKVFIMNPLDKRKYCIACGSREIKNKRDEKIKNDLYREKRLKNY